MHTSNKVMLLKAVQKIMKPLARLLMHHGISYREFTDLSKKAFFFAGQEVLEQQAQRPNASQLSVLTGLHRKDVTAFLEEASQDPKAQDLPHTTSTGAALVAQWLTDPTYLDKKKKPLPLPYTADTGPSFTRLVEAVSKDIRPKAHLEHLTQLGLVETNDAGHITLKRDAFLPNEDFKAKLEFFVRHIHDHLAATTANLTSTTPVFPDRSAFHANLTDSDIKLLRAEIDQKAMSLLKDIYAQAEKLSAKNAGSQATQRMTLGFYFYTEDAAP